MGAKGEIGHAQPEVNPRATRLHQREPTLFGVKPKQVSGEGLEGMRPLANTTSRLNTVRELFAFMWARKLFWMIPMVFMLVLIAVLMIFAAASPAAPFIYSLI